MVCVSGEHTCGRAGASVPVPFVAVRGAECLGLWFSPRITGSLAGRCSGRDGVPASSPQGLPTCLPCRNPRRRRRRRRRRAKPAKPPLVYWRSTSERERWWDSGNTDHAHLFSQHSSPCQHHGLPRNSFWREPGGIAGAWTAVPPPGTHRRAGVVCLGETPVFTTCRSAPRPSPRRSGSWWAGAEGILESVLAGCLAFPPPHPTGESLPIITESKLTPEVNFF